MEDFKQVLGQLQEHIPTEEEWGMVFYSDGGFRSLKGVAGWGLHGYIYDHVEKKSGYGLKRCDPTVAGYAGPGIRTVDEKGKALRMSLKNPVEAVPCRICCYVDGYGNGYKEGDSNNTAEMYGLKFILDIIAEYKPPRAQLILDSQYALKGAIKWIHGWKANGWKKSSGEGDIANLDLWKEIEALLTLIESQGTKLSWDWVKGHLDDIGNIAADRLAGMSMACAENDVDRTHLKISPTAKYWTPTAKVHPLLKEPRLYLSINPERPPQDESGMYYHFGNTGPKEEVRGQPSADKGYMVICIPEKDKVIEDLREYFVMKCLANPNAFIIEVRNDILTNAKIHNDIFEYGAIHLESDSTKQIVKNVHAKNIAEALDPPNLAFQTLQQLSALELRLRQTLKGELPSHFTVTEITDLVLETVIGKKENTLKAISGTNAFVTGELQIKVLDEIVLKKVPLIYGTDIPRRNIISSVAHLNPKLFLLSWMDSGVTARYASILISDAGAGIWCGVYSNVTFIT